MFQTIWSILWKWKEKIVESLPKVWSAIGNTFAKFKDIGTTWRQKTIGERAKTYYGKEREQTKSDFSYFNISSLKEAFKTIWTKPKSLLWDPIKWFTVATAMTLWGWALSMIPNTAVATGKWIVATGSWALGTGARVVEWIARWWLGMADEAVSKFADVVDFTDKSWSAPATPKPDKAVEKKPEDKTWEWKK